VCARYINSSGCLQSAFLGVTELESDGARGLLEAVAQVVGITTDGESANTGKHGSLWKLLQAYLTLPVGWMPALRQTPSTEATAWAQCANYYRVTGRKT